MTAGMELPWGLEALISLLLVAGGVFALIGSLGLARLPDFYMRLHAPTKASTLGLGCLLAGSWFFFAATGHGFSVREFLVSVFLFVTAPVSAHMMARSALHRRVRARDALPDVSQDSRER